MYVSGSQVPNFLMSQVRKLNENSSRRYQFYDKRIKNLLRKIHTDSRDKPEKSSSEASLSVSSSLWLSITTQRPTKLFPEYEFSPVKNNSYKVRKLPSPG